MRARLLPIICLFALSTITSCSKDIEDQPNETQYQVEKDMQNGTWTITKFIDSEKTGTSSFSGYDFTFTAGEINATNGLDNYSGIWSIANHKSDDDSMDDLHFIINFNLTNEFEDLNDHWDIISQSTIKIELMDVSGGNGGTDYLSFEKK